MDQALDRGNAGAAGHNDDILSFELLHRPPVAIAAAQEDGIARFQAEKPVGHFPHFADGEVHIAVPKAADGDRRFPHLRKGELHELAVPDRNIILHAEGPFRLRLRQDLKDFLRMGFYRIVKHAAFPPPV